MSLDTLARRIRAATARPADKRAYVSDLFGRVAPRYDLTNDVMSAGLHRRWKRQLLKLADIRPGHVVLDLAAGTGDLARGALPTRLEEGGAGHTGRRPDRAAREGPGTVIAGDLTREMLDAGRARAGSEGIDWVRCDAAALPFVGGSLDRVLIGYGLRNFADLDASLVEIRRCLRPGGRLLALDFGHAAPRPLHRGYLGYLEWSTAAVGWLLHRDMEAYVYIPESLRRYPGQEGVSHHMLRAGFTRCGHLDLLFGTMAINFGERPG